MSENNKKSITKRLVDTSSTTSIKVRVYYGDKQLVDCMKSVIRLRRSRYEQGE